MKKLRLLLVSLCFLSIFFLKADSASAFEFNFYYQEIEEVYDPANTAPGLGFTQTVSNWFGDEKVEIRKSKYVPVAGSEDDGHSQIAYKIRTKKVSTLNELYSAMGVTQEDYSEGKLTNGQKALIDTYIKARGSSIRNRSEHAFNKKCDVYLTDSTDYDYDDNVSNYVKNALKKDFWPCASGDKKSIQMSSRFFSTDLNTEHAVSTFVHEYSHTLDKSEFQDKNPYGLDGTHKINEITTRSGAFKEAWAEYNEMIEYDSVYNNYSKYSCATSTLTVESTTDRGSYTNIKAFEATAEQLLCCEMFMNRLLYEIHQKIGKDENGNDKVSMAFYASNGKDNNMSNLIKQLIKDNPDDAMDIFKIVDDVTLNKMTDDELIDFLGKSEELGVYLASRESSSGDSGSTTDVTKTTIVEGSVDENAARREITTGVCEDNISGESVIIETDSDNPFE